MSYLHREELDPVSQSQYDDFAEAIKGRSDERLLRMIAAAEQDIDEADSESDVYYDSIRLDILKSEALSRNLIGDDES